MMKKIQYLSPSFSESELCRVVFGNESFLVMRCCDECNAAAGDISTISYDRMGQIRKIEEERRK